MEKNIQIMAHHWLKLLICLVVLMNAQVHEAGQVQEIGGLKCYVSGNKESNISVILASDVFGYEVPHLRQLADKVGAAGFYTLVPDFFNGDPFVSDDPKKPFNEWITKHPSEKGIEYAKPVIEALKGKGITKIGAAGFCWGGKVTVDLTKSLNYIQAAVLLHPTSVTVEDIKGVKVPISILGGQNDTLSPPNLLKQYEFALKAKPKVSSFVKIFPGAEHGWTTRYNDTDAVGVKRAEAAHKDMLNWFHKYLK